MALDKFDKQLLYELDHNARATLNELSKKVRLSKNSINLRIQKLEQKTIKQAYTLIDIKVLGYEYFKVYFKLQNIDDEKEKEIIDYFSYQTQSLWVSSWDGSYDLMVGILAKSISEFYDVLQQAINKFKDNINSYDIFIVVSAPHFYRDYLSTEKKLGFEELTFGREKILLELDEVDKKILKTISTNARISFVKLSQKTKLTFDVVRYRLKQLEKKGIIQGYRILPNYNEIQVNPYKILLNLQNLNTKTQNSIVAYARTIPQIVDIIVKGVGLWNAEIQIDAKNHEEFHEIMREFKNKFNQHIKDYKTLILRKEHKLDYFPFK